MLEQEGLLTSKMDVALAEGKTDAVAQVASATARALNERSATNATAWRRSRRLNGETGVNASSWCESDGGSAATAALRSRMVACLRDSIHLHAEVEASIRATGDALGQLGENECELDSHSLDLGAEVFSLLVSKAEAAETFAPASAEVIVDAMSGFFGATGLEIDYLRDGPCSATTQSTRPLATYATSLQPNASSGGAVDVVMASLAPNGSVMSLAPSNSSSSAEGGQLSCVETRGYHPQVSYFTHMLQNPVKNLLLSALFFLKYFLNND